MINIRKIKCHNIKARLILFNILVVLLFIPHESHAIEIDSLSYRFGVFGNYPESSLRFNSINFTQVPNCCDENSITDNSGLNIGIIGKVNLLSFLDIGTRLGYNKLTTSMQSSEFIGNTEYNGDLFPVYSNHSLDTEFEMISLEPFISYLPFNNFPVSLSFGSQIGFIINSSYSQSEILDEESAEKGVSFFDGENDLGQTRNNLTGLIPNEGLYFTLSSGLSYEFEPIRNIQVSPELFYHYNLNNIVEHNNWRISYISAGLSISYAINTPDEKEIPIIKSKEPQEIDTTDSEEDVTLNESIAAPEENSENTEAKDIAITEDLSEIKMNNTSLTEDTRCCYLIIATDRNNTKINNFYRELTGIVKEYELRIENWLNPSSESIYYRIRTQCFKGSANAIRAKFELAETLNKNNFQFNLITKCE